MFYNICSQLYYMKKLLQFCITAYRNETIHYFCNTVFADLSTVADGCCRLYAGT